MDIIFDIDGTVANPKNRLKYLEKPNKNFSLFMYHMKDDTRIEPVKYIYDLLLKDGNNIIFASGRNENYRDMTEEWLLKHGFIDYQKLYMRKEKDNRPDKIIKRELYQEMLDDGFKPTICFDDRLSVVKMWKEIGVFCFCVNQGLKEF